MMPAEKPKDETEPNTLIEIKPYLAAARAIGELQEDMDQRFGQVNERLARIETKTDERFDVLLNAVLSHSQGGFSNDPKVRLLITVGFLALAVGFVGSNMELTTPWITLGLGGN
jgi:hypothetical protein